MSSAEAVRPSAAGAWLQLARISNTPTVVSNTVAGAILTSSAADTGTVAVVAVAMALFYTAGMILNDVLDLEVDRPSRTGAASFAAGAAPTAARTTAEDPS